MSNKKNDDELNQETLLFVGNLISGRRSENSELIEAPFIAREQEIKKRFAYQFRGGTIDLQIEAGWLDLIERTCILVDLNISLPERKTFRWLQIKEKFGGLRMYYAGGPTRIDMFSAEGAFQIKVTAKKGSTIHGIVACAEAASCAICAVCGRDGRLRTDRAWVRTLCDQHAFGDS